jgi:large subunit ribosomal protein L9
MKIILLQDVYKKGVAGEVVEVAPGYARNFLIPRGMAAKATPGAMRAAEGLRNQAVVRRAQRDQEYSELAEQIREMQLFFGVRAGETGKLYGSVTPADIAEQIKTQYGVELDRRRVGDHALRELGEFMIPVRLEAGLAPQLKVVIFREGQDPRLTEAAEAPEQVAEPVIEAAEPPEQVAEPVTEAAEAPEQTAEPVEDTETPATADVDMAEETPSS